MKIKTLLTVVLISFMGINLTNARNILVTEENEVNADNFIINADNSANDFVDLEFGSALNAKLRYDITNDIFILNKDIRINQILDSNGNTGENNEVLISDGSGKNLWGTLNANLPPFISNNAPQNLAPSTSATLGFSGYNFLPNSVVSIPNFNGTINSVNIISPVYFEINVTADSNEDIYDVVISNGVNVNTQWTGNGNSLIRVSEQNGNSQDSAAESCKYILDNNHSTGDGYYWINPDGGDTSNAFQVYCDMTTDGGGWTKIPYSADLPHQNHFSGSDRRRWLNNNFSLSLTDEQINNIRSVSTEGKQTYVGTCQGVIHYLYQTSNYNHAFGFRYHNGHQTNWGQSTYPSTNISVVTDGCKVNNSSLNNTVFEIHDVRLPVINVNSLDNGGSNEKFGSPLTNNPAWFR